jgi:outer membrane protein
MILMMNRPKRLVVAMSLLMASAAQGQDLLQVYDLALENDAVIRERQQQLAAALEIKPQAKALLLPNIGVDANADRIRRDVNSTRGSAPTGTDTFNDTGLSINLLQPVYNREYWMQLKQADDVIARAEAQYADAQLDLMARVIQAYFNVLAAQDNLTVSKGQKEANLRQLDQAKQRFDVGLIAITDVHEAQAAFDAARAAEIAAENSLDNAWEALYEIIGPQPKSNLAKLSDALRLTPPVPKDLQAWSDTAQQQNFDIIAAGANLESLRQEVDVSRAGHYPTLDLVGGYNLSRSDSDTATEADLATIGLSLEVPLYTGGAVSAQTRQAQANYRAAQEGLDQTRRAVIRQVRDAYRGVLSSISQVEALKAATVSAQSALESTQAGYEVGTRTIVDVLNVQRNLFSSQRDYLNSRYGYILNGLSLKSAAGTLGEEDLQRVNAWLEP